MTPGALLIRADASVAIGTGHVMRCLALAQAWQDAGGDAAFAMAQSTPAIEQRLRSEGMRVDTFRQVPGSDEDAQASIEAARTCDAKWIVVDGYQFGEDYQRSLKEAGLKVLFVDDNGHAEHYPADLVLNQNAQANAEMYRSRGCDTRLLLGPRYALLRREFVSQRNFRREIPAIGRKVLVTMGGSDPGNVTLRVLDAIDHVDIRDLQVSVVVGGSNPHAKSVIERIGRCRHECRLVVDAPNMWELITWADLAISAAGSVCWEYCLLGLPAVLLVVAENQRPAAVALRAAGAAVLADGGGEMVTGEMADLVSRLVNSPAERQSLSEKAKTIVDGGGVERVLSRLLAAGTS